MAGPQGREPGGIFGLLDLIDRHRGAFEYDWRTRFHVPFDPPKFMDWGEVYRLTLILLSDPSSRVAAANLGWANPVSREWMALADLFDLQGRAKHGRKHKSYPRPWVESKRRIGTPVSKAEWHRIKSRNQEVADG